MKHDYDYLVVGLGLSGSVLSRMLIEKGKKILVIDKFNSNSSSQVAAGLVNPVTGRRVVKSWMADELIPFAKKYYREIEQQSGLSFYHVCDVLEVVHSVKEVNDWTSRMSDPGMTEYLIDNSPEDLYKDKIAAFNKMFRITSSGWMNMPVFIEQTRKELFADSALLEEYFNHSMLDVFSSGIKYGEVTAGRIIFCEGYKTLNNPFWNKLPFLPAKGEIITIRCEALPENYILMSGIFIIPIGEKKFRVGSTYEWNFTHEKTTEEGKIKLLKLLDDFLLLPYVIIDHRAGVRPTVQDRRPIIGSHPVHKNVFVFNGLGTKGVILAPYFAHQFTEYLENGGSLMNEVNVKRWKGKLKIDLC